MSALQTIIDAIALGSIYALVAMGIGLIFGVMRLVNFAQGELLTAGAYSLIVTIDLPLVVRLFPGDRIGGRGVGAPAEHVAPTRYVDERFGLRDLEAVGPFLDILPEGEVRVLAVSG